MGHRPAQLDENRTRLSPHCSHHAHLHCLAQRDSTLEKQSTTSRCEPPESHPSTRPPQNLYRHVDEFPSIFFLHLHRHTYLQTYSTSSLSMAMQSPRLVVIVLNAR